MLCVAGYNEVDNYPRDLVTHLQPRLVALIHWENFFSRLPEDPQDLRPTPFLNVRIDTPIFHFYGHFVRIGQPLV